MSHYFKTNSSLKSEIKTIKYTINNQEFRMETDNGVFAKDGLDFATKLMLECFSLAKSDARILDLGCGYGVVGKYIKVLFPKTRVDMVDINENALVLAKKNTSDIDVNVFYSDAYHQTSNEYDVIITNPPIHAGKQVVHTFLLDAYQYLAPNGELWFVMNKKHGLNSALDKLVEIFDVAETIEKKKGFSVIRCIKLCQNM